MYKKKQNTYYKGLFIISYSLAFIIGVIGMYFNPKPIIIPLTLGLIGIFIGLIISYKEKGF